MSHVTRRRTTVAILKTSEFVLEGQVEYFVELNAYMSYFNVTPAKEEYESVEWDGTMITGASCQEGCVLVQTLRLLSTYVTHQRTWIIVWVCCLILLEAMC